MIYPLFMLKKDDDYVQVVPKIVKNKVDGEGKKTKKVINTVDFIKKVSDKFKNVPEHVSFKDTAFLSIAGYIMLELLHKVNPGICIDSITNLKGKQHMLSLHQAAVLFATGIKIGRALPKELEFEIEEERNISLWK